MRARDTAASGALALLMITGEPGIGKTRLAAEVARACATDGDLILYGRCNEEPLSPFEAFRNAFHNVARLPVGQALLQDEGAPVEALTQVVPEVTDRPGPSSGPGLVTAEAERFQSFEAVAWLIASLARRRPLVLVLEDLHWADAPALSLLEHVLQSRIAAPVLIIGTYRDTEIAGRNWLAEGLVGLRRVAAITRIDLEGLSSPMSLALVESAIGSSGAGLGPIASRLRDFTGGNPFFLQEVASDVVASGGPLEGALAFDAAVATGSTISDRLRELVQWRLMKLSEPCKQVLSVAALIGLHFSVGVLLATCDHSEADVLTVLDEAQDAGVIAEATDSDDTYRFVHDLVRTALDAGFGPARRVRTHLRIGQQLEARHGLDPGHAPEVALHYVHGIAAGSADRARLYCRLAGTEALAHVAYEAAVQHFQHALDISTIHFPEDHDARCELLLLVADAMVKSGRLVDADERFLQAFDEGQAHGLHDVVAAAALGYGGVLPAGVEPSEDGQRLLRTALDDLGPGDSSDRALALGRLAHWGHFSESRESRELLADEAIEVALRLDDPAILATTIEYRYWALCGPDDVARQVDDGRRIREIGEAVGDPELVLRGMKCELHAEFEGGSFTTAQSIAMEMQGLAASIGQPEYLRLGFMWDSLVAGIQGRFDDAEVSATRAYDIFQRSGHSQSQAIAVGLSLTWLWLQGRMSEMGPILEAGRTGRSSIGEKALAAWVAVESGHHIAAADVLAQLTPESVAAQDRNFHWWFMMAGLSHTAISLGDVQWADALYGLIAPFASHNCRVGQATFLGSADFYLGSLARVAEQPILAVSHLAGCTRPPPCHGSGALHPPHRARAGTGGTGPRSVRRCRTRAQSPLVAGVGIEMSDDVREHVDRCISTDDGVQMAVAVQVGDGEVTGRPLGAERLVQPGQRPLGTLRVEDVVPGPRQEVDGEVQPIDIGKVPVEAPCVHGSAPLEDQDQLAQTGQVGHAEQVRQFSMGCIVELGVDMGAPEHCVDPSAGREPTPLAPGHRHGSYGEVEGQIRRTPQVVRVQPCDPERGEPAADAEARLRLVEARGDRMDGELGAHRRADAGRPVQKGHQERDRADAVPERLHVLTSGDRSHLCDGPGPVDPGDVIDRPLLPCRRELDASPIVEQPDVVPVAEQVLHQARAVGRHRERRGRHREPGSQDDRSLGTAPVADETRAGIRYCLIVPAAGAVTPPNDLRGQPAGLRK